MDFRLKLKFMRINCEDCFFIYNILTLFLKSPDFFQFFPVPVSCGNSELQKES